MITSMNQSELYKTLVGHYKPNHYTYFPDTSSGKTAEKTAASKGIPENAVKIEDMPVYKDISNEPNVDRFILSDKIVNQKDIVAALSQNELKEMPYTASDAIDFRCNDICHELESGYDNGLVTKERIAEYFGAMAKRLDQAYAEGKFTKDEYDELNNMVESQVEIQAGLYERLKASYALGKERGSLSYEAAKVVIQRQKSMTSEEFMAEQDKMISDYVEKYFKIDRTALMKMFNSIRYGK